ncbi:hypothetical protein AX14_010117, partial [Amanita brunnescens Koide BX004]
MSVIRRLGERVEKEHDQFLRDAQRIEDRSALAVNGSNTQSFGTVDFENLIGSSGGITVKADTMTENKSWEDNVWGSIFDDNPLKNPTPLASPMPPPSHVPLESKSETPQLGLGARTSWTLPPPLPPPSNLRSSSLDMAKSQPTSVNRPPPQRAPSAKPNYNISLSTTPIPPTTNVYTAGLSPLTNQSTVTKVMQPTMSTILAPSKPVQTSSNGIHKLSKN